MTTIWIKLIEILEKKRNQLSKYKCLKCHKRTIDFFGIFVFFTDQRSWQRDLIKYRDSAKGKRNQRTYKRIFRRINQHQPNENIRLLTSNSDLFFLPVVKRWRMKKKMYQSVEDRIQSFVWDDFFDKELIADALINTGIIFGKLILQ